MPTKKAVMARECEPPSLCRTAIHSREPAFAKASAGESTSPPKLRSSEGGRARELGGPDAPPAKPGIARAGP